MAELLLASVVIVEFGVKQGKGYEEGRALIGVELIQHPLTVPRLRQDTPGPARAHKV